MVILITCIYVFSIQHQYELETLGTVSCSVYKYCVFSFDPDPTRRATFWTGTFGGISLCLSMFSSSQTIIQKAITCRTLKDGQRSDKKDAEFAKDIFPYEVKVYKLTRICKR